jgi:hypothetical protein
MRIFTFKHACHIGETVFLRTTFFVLDREVVAAALVPRPPRVPDGANVNVDCLTLLFPVADFDGVLREVVAEVLLNSSICVRPII